jgi:hypothetical protein
VSPIGDRFAGIRLYNPGSKSFSPDHGDVHEILRAEFTSGTASTFLFASLPGNVRRKQAMRSTLSTRPTLLAG